ncbi:MAG TPA: bifunctional precorrin-2 dehydrogenase/sirohydrochlorin ferrochelatase, partial [Proteobacteria bacterium]|nr:bifunctional precorrin-2 dehydrogenase/sirohydrochlorin ferrochelatase [Pseudomonadota bacterium]
MALYPIFLKLDGRRCLVVGGGRVALRKVKDLLDAGASVVVVAPSFVRELEEIADRIELVKREFDQRDLDGVAIAVAATDSDEANRRVHRAARSRGVWVNVVDSPELCDFFLPARARLGNLEIAVSTLGRSPLASRLIRDAIRDSIRDEHLKL